MTIRTYVSPLRYPHSVLSASIRLLFAFKSRRNVSSTASSFVDHATRVSSRFQIYISQSHDPFLNLSIEHYLLQKTPIVSTVLFLYVNEPCVVIGRNQNPWLEADLQVLAAGSAKVPTSTIIKQGNAGLSGPIQLLRRRSGGGTVFHDHGNMNYSVICPTTNFTRDKHTEMVVQAIRGDNDRARVNERHDIVLDQGQRLPAGSIPDSRDMYKTAYSLGVNELPSLKVSGSAYKLTRTRSLHHGTCLLNSPNLDLISRCLQSPAKSFIKARGVESVRSPVSNIYSGSEVDAHSRFRAHMLAAFSSLYGLESDFMDAFSVLNENGRLKCGGSWVAGYLTDCLSEIPEIRMGVRELQSSEWVYGQTPQFTLSTHPTEDDERARPSLLSELPASAQVNIKVRSGIITFAEILLATDNHSSTNRELIKDTLKGLHICKIKDFNTLSQKPNEFDNGEGARCLWKWLNKILGKV